jgi:hypothetical protein
VIADTKAPRVPGSSPWAKDGGQERKGVYRGAAEGQRRSLGLADGLQQGRLAVGSRRLWKRQAHVIRFKQRMRYIFIYVREPSLVFVVT